MNNLQDKKYIEKTFFVDIIQLFGVLTFDMKLYLISGINLYRILNKRVLITKIKEKK
jgi:hypothetical protein